MNIWDSLDPEELDDVVKAKLTRLLDDIAELKLVNEKIYYKFLCTLSNLAKKPTIDVGVQSNFDNREEEEEKIEEKEEKIEEKKPAENVVTEEIVAIDTKWSGDITNEVKAIAEQTVNQSGFVFDRTTGSYYNHIEKCFYIPDYKLYYYQDTGTYYYYDEESQSLKFYSSVTADEISAVSQNRSWPSYQENIPKKKKSDKKHKTEKEEGECTDEDETEQNTAVISAAPKAFDPNVIVNHSAPCVRFIVKTTELKNLSVGQLFIVTMNGGSMGREGKHDVLIPDRNVSKFHSLFYYNYNSGQSQYTIVDVGSKNGTFIDGVRLSDSLVKSNPVVLTHGCTLSVGCTELLCHIHEADRTCQECEPSSVMFKVTSTSTTKTLNLKEQHDLEEKQLRKKFGLTKGQSEFKGSKKYEDRAEQRRLTEGSSHPSEKTEIASVEFPLTEKNKGFTMLTKLGWKEGETLGKDHTQGLVEPIQPVQARGKRGFGTVEPFEYNVNEKSKKDLLKDSILNKTRKRFLANEKSKPVEENS